MPKINAFTIIEDPTYAFSQQVSIIQNVFSHCGSFVDVLISRKFPLLRYLPETSLRPMLLGSVETFGPTIANMVALTPSVFLMSKHLQI